MDVWSLGCIFAELLLGGKPLFPGHSEIDQLARIFELCGTPDETNWPDASQLPTFFEFTHALPKPFNAVFVGVPSVALDLLEKMLTLNPAARISAAEVARFCKCLCVLYICDSTYASTTDAETPILFVSSLCVPTGGATFAFALTYVWRLVVGCQPLTI